MRLFMNLHAFVYADGSAAKLQVLDGPDTDRGTHAERNYAGSVTRAERNNPVTTPALLPYLSGDMPKRRSASAGGRRAAAASCDLGECDLWCSRSCPCSRSNRRGNRSEEEQDIRVTALASRRARQIGASIVWVAGDCFGNDRRNLLYSCCVKAHRRVSVR